MRYVIRYLVANARVFCEAVLYHGSLRFLAMNPAVLVILWIRLSVTFGYPATLTISKIFGDTPVYKGISEPDQLTIPYGLEDVKSAQYTSPFFTSYPSNLILRKIRESSTVPEFKDDTQIISIVRVSSSSMVKPKVIVNRSNEISVSVSTKNSKNRTVAKLEDFVTPFVSLLRKNRLDVDEDVPKETYKIESHPTGINYVPSYKAKLTDNLNSSFKPVIDYFDNYSQISATNRLDSTLHHNSKSTFNDTDIRTEQYVDTTDRVDTKKGKQLDPVYEEVYDEQEYAESEQVYGETEKIYGEPEKIYGEPEKVYGESEKVYGETEKIYGEPEKVYGETEKIYGEPEKVYGEPEKIYGEPEKIYGEPEKVYQESEKNYEEPEKISEISHQEPETEFEKHDNDFKIPESSENSKPYSSFTTKINDKKSSYIVDNGTYRKYRVEEKTSDGFIVGEYGMVSHQDGSLRGVRYTADSNINPSLIYETLVKFLSLK